MWKAHDQLGWSFAKIGSVFNRDWRTVKHLVEQKQKSYSLVKMEKKIKTSSSGFVKHFDALAEVAKTIFDVQQLIHSYGKDESFTVIESQGITGFFSFYPLPKKHAILPSFAGPSVSVDYPEAEYLLEHLRQDFLGLGLDLGNWRKLVMSGLPHDVVERLRYLANTAKFKYCPTCQVCKDLMA